MEVEFDVDEGFAAVVEFALEFRSWYALILYEPPQSVEASPLQAILQPPSVA